MLLEFLPAVLLFVAGWLIRYKKATWRISGYNLAPRKEKDSYDVEKLTRAMGAFVFTLAGIFFVIAASRLLFPGYAQSITSTGVGVFIVTVVVGLVYLNTGKRLLKD